MAEWSASAARFEQCIFTGGRPSSASATVAFDIFSASVRSLPFTSSVTIELVAMAAPQPKVLNFTSVILSFSTFIVSFIMSPQAGLPTMPVPLGFSTSPTFLGLEKWSITFSLYILCLLKKLCLLLRCRVERRHRPHPLHDGRHYLDEVVYLPGR